MGGRARPDTRSREAPKPGLVAAERGRLRRGRGGALAGHCGCPRAAWRPGAPVARRPPGYVTVTSLPSSAMPRPARPLIGRPAEAPREDWRPRPCLPRPSTPSRGRLLARLRPRRELALLRRRLAGHAAPRHSFVRAFACWFAERRRVSLSIKHPRIGSQHRVGILKTAFGHLFFPPCLLP